MRATSLVLALYLSAPASWPWSSAMPRVPDRACGVVAVAIVKLREVVSVASGKRYAEVMICYRDKEDGATAWLEIK